MLSTRRIKARYGDNICRRCINKEYNVRLVPPDCRYGYMFRCPCCRRQQNIVVGFTASGKLKMLLK